MHLRHDVRVMSRICPAAMIFVPRAAGASHNPAERTDEGQLIKGAEVLLETVRRWTEE